MQLKALVCAVAILAAGVSTVRTQSPLTVPDGYRVELVASGLSGPEGLVAFGAGQVAVVEATDLPAPPRPPSQLTLVSRSGHARPLAVHEALDVWVAAAGHPGGGFYVASLQGLPADLPGIYHVDVNGAVTRTPAPAAHYVNVALDGRTGDLYAAQVPLSGGIGSIAMMAPSGFVTTIRDRTRAQGLVVTGDRVLIAAVQRRNVGGAFFTNQVIAWDLASGEETVLATDVGALAGALAMSRSGNLYLSDFRDGAIRRLEPNGSGGYAVSEFVSGLSTSSLRYPGPNPQSFNYLAFDPSGALYVTDFGAGTLYRIAGRF